MKHLYIFLLIVFLIGCNNKKQTTAGASEVAEEMEIVEEVEREEQEAVVEPSATEQLIDYLNQHQFESASQLINDSAIDINELFESNRGPKWLVGSTLLTSMLLNCDQEIISYLLQLNVDPNLPAVTYGYEEWSPNTISADIDLKEMEKSSHDGFTIKESPLEKSLSCEEKTIFYRLIEAGANDQSAILKGAIKWEDTLLLKKNMSEEVSIDFVPGTERMDILKILVPITDGTQYGEIGYGEGGDMFDSDLMYACEANNAALVWFMLETGADPNHCLPKNYVDGEYIEPDSAGYYPASTPLSIAKAQYESNMEIHSNRENDTTYLQKANDSQEIIKLLEEHGATDVSKCLGP